MSGFTDASSGGLHVIPMNDLRPHESLSTCWCKPARDTEEETVWIHNSMDRREHSVEKGIIQ